MTGINIDTGTLYINNKFFPQRLENLNNNSHKMGKISYSNLLLIGEIGDLLFKANACYINENLISILLFIDPKYIKEKYSESINDNLEEYVTFCKKVTDKLLYELIKKNKRSFKWGKIKILVDPRDPFVYAEIKYFK